MTPAHYRWAFHCADLAQSGGTLDCPVLACLDYVRLYRVAGDVAAAFVRWVP